MSKTILITGSTDGIGRLTAEMLVSMGHHVVVHGRSAAKLEAVVHDLTGRPGGGTVHGMRCDLSRLGDVRAFAEAVAAQHPHLDVLINNAGVFAGASEPTADGLDPRFAVNTVAPYLLTQRLLPVMGPSGRVINLSSAAQAPVDLEALAGQRPLADMAAYAQSKLAITAWSWRLAQSVGDAGPSIVAVNPGSMLGTKMVKQAFGAAGHDVGIGADILVRLAVGEEGAAASGTYFDNDARRFGPPHPDAHDPAVAAGIVDTIEDILERAGGN